MFLKMRHSDFMNQTKKRISEPTAFDWDNDPVENIYWFCLRRNASFQDDIDWFEEKLLPIVELYNPDIIIGKRMSRWVRRYATDKGLFIYAPDVDAIDKRDVRYDLYPEHLEEIRRLNHSYRDFVRIWRIAPRRYDKAHSPCPNLLPIPKGKVSASDYEPLLKHSVTISLDPHSNKKEIIRLADKKMSQAVKKIASMYPEKGGKNLISLENIKTRLRVFEIYERFHSMGISRIDSSWKERHLKKGDPKSRWPKDIMEIYTDLMANTKAPEYSNLTKDLHGAVECISYPPLVLRSVLYELSKRKFKP